MSEQSTGNNLSENGSVHVPKVSGIQRFISWIRNRVIPQISLKKTPEYVKKFRWGGWLFKLFLVTLLGYSVICFVTMSWVNMFATLELRFAIVMFYAIMVSLCGLWESET